MDLQPEDFARVGEEQERVRRRGGEERLHEIFVLNPYADLPFATAPLSTIERGRIPLDVAGMGNCDDDFFLGDQILKAGFRLLL